MAEYAGNSNKAKEAAAEIQTERKVQKVVSGKVTTRENKGRKLTKLFIEEDVDSVKSHIFMDIFIPAAKRLISDIVRDGIDMMLYGEPRGDKKKSGSRVSYRDYYDERNSSRDRGRYASTRDRFDNDDDIIFDSRGEAEAVLDEMDNMIARYGLVTVSDMYDMAGLTAPYTATKYGWTSLRNASVERVRGNGYVIKLSKASPID